MDELILLPSRSGEIFRVALCFLFGAAGVAMAVGGLIGAFSSLAGIAPGLFLAALGGACAVVFGIPLLQGLQILRSSGLRLTAAGFELNNRFRSWTDIEAFDVAGGS